MGVYVHLFKGILPYNTDPNKTKKLKQKLFKDNWVKDWNDVKTI